MWQWLFEVFVMEFTREFDIERMRRVVLILLNLGFSQCHIPLVLSPVDDYYEVRDYETVKFSLPYQTQTKSSVDELQAVVACPVERKYVWNRTFGVVHYHDIILLVYPKDDLDVVPKICKGDYMPSFNRDPYLVEEFAIENDQRLAVAQLGYAVCDKKKLLRKEDQIPLKKDCDFFTNLEILFDEEIYQAKFAKYCLSDYPGQEIRECPEDRMEKYWGHERWRIMKYAYSMVNQNNVLQSMIPSSVGLFDDKTRCEDDPKRVTIWIKQPYREYLVEQLLAPRQDFDIEAVGSLACSYLNMAPMWGSIATEAWGNVEVFVRHVAQALFRPEENKQRKSRTKSKESGSRSAENVSKRQNPSKRKPKRYQGKLSVITGVDGVLDVETFTDNECKKKKLFLWETESFTVPVPQRFWKLLILDVPRHEQYVGYRYGIFLVTDNTKLPLERLCDDVCIAWGWAGINMRAVYPQTYCCAVNERNWKRFGVSLSLFKLPISDFNLNSLTLRNANGELIRKVNILETIDSIRNPRW